MHIKDSTLATIFYLCLYQCLPNIKYVDWDSRHCKIVEVMRSIQWKFSSLDWINLPQVSLSLSLSLSLQKVIVFLYSHFDWQWRRKEATNFAQGTHLRFAGNDYDAVLAPLNAFLRNEGPHIESNLHRLCSFLVHRRVKRAIPVKWTWIIAAELGHSQNIHNLDIELSWSKICLLRSKSCRNSQIC